MNTLLSRCEQAPLLTRAHTAQTLFSGTTYVPRHRPLLRTSVAFAVGVLLVGGTAYAQNRPEPQPPSQGLAQVDTNQNAEAPKPAPTLATVTVSASGLQLGIDEMTTPSAVLEGDGLTLRRQSTLGETLAHELGISSSHFGAGASRPVIRGMDGARVKVLTGGAEVQDASTVSPDHAVVAEPMLATQIEILRGPSALLYGGGAVGGVVNVIDNKIPTAIPNKGFEGSAELKGSTGAHEGAGAFSLTGGQGAIAVHVQGAVRDADNYRVGRGWQPDGIPTAKVPGSFNRTDTGGLGVSWIGDRSYLGIAYTHQTAYYGLPGDSGALFGDCTAAANRLQCPAQPPSAGAVDPEDVPIVDLRSKRMDVRGEWRNPWSGIAAVRLKAGVTDYAHDELEDGAIGTRFTNKAKDFRLELQHDPIAALAGIKGVVGLQTSSRDFKADGDEAYIEPTSTHKLGLFALQEYRRGDWRLEAALRHDRQTAQAQTSDIKRTHSGTSASLGATWRFMPGYSLGANFTRASRAPTAEELYASGLHLATRTYEQGNADLRSEASHNIDLSLRKTSGETTFGLSVFHNRIKNYIYGRTVDELGGLQLLQYSQSDATFTGIEAEVRHRFSRQFDMTVFGDAVRARLVDGSALPRIPSARFGLRLNTQWQSWQGQLEWIHVARQNRVAAFETVTPGYGIVNVGVVYRHKTVNGTPWQFYVQANNLTDKLAYAHTSYIKTQAPLLGRSLAIGVKVDF